MEELLRTRLADEDKPIKGLLFDKDGTLIYLDDLWIQPTADFIEILLKRDPKDFKQEEINQVLSEIGIVDGQLLANSMAASGTIQSQADFLSQYIHQSAESICLEMTDYFTNYLKDNPDKLVPVCDLQNLFKELKEKGYAVGLATSDSRKPTDMALELLGIAELLDFVATPDEYEEKPHPQALQQFANQAQLKMEEILYIGDSFIDMQFGKHGAGSVGVLTGNTSAQELEGRADFIVDSVAIFFDK